MRGPPTPALRVGGDLVVAAATGVQTSSRGADALGQHPLDGHVDVLVLDVPLEAARFDLAVYLRESGLDRVGVSLGDDALLGKHSSVRDRASDVLGPHSLVYW